MKARSFIDWVSFTLPLSRPLSFAELWDKVAVVTHTETRLWTRCNPLYGYDMAFTYGVGIMAMAHSFKPEMGIHVQLSGGGLETIIPNVGGVYELLDEIEASEGKVTRLDISIDAFDSGMEISMLELLIDDERTVKASSKHLAISSSGGGKTLYVGSRQSERYLRIYNKSAERLAAGADNAFSDDWKRIELEVKGKKAQALAHTLVAAEKPQAAIIRDWIVGFIDFPQYDVWRAVMGETSAIMSISHRKLTNSRKWLLSTVCTAIAKELIKDRDFTQAFQDSLESALWDAWNAANPSLPQIRPDVKIVIDG